jgi:hypothetical protein
MPGFQCPHLQGEVECTDERERHIAERYPDLLPEHRERIAQTLAEPEQVRCAAYAFPLRVYFRDGILRCVAANMWSSWS